MENDGRAAGGSNAGSGSSVVSSQRAVEGDATDAFATQRAAPGLSSDSEGEVSNTDDVFATQRGPPVIERYLVPITAELISAGAQPVALVLERETVVGAARGNAMKPGVHSISGPLGANVDSGGVLSRAQARFDDVRFARDVLAALEAN